MNVRRERHTSKKISTNSLQEVVSKTPSALQNLNPLEKNMDQKLSDPAAAASKEDTEIQPSTVTDPQNSAPRYGFNTDIPDRYNETYIVAIPRDPNWLYVYWEFSDETAHLMNSNLEQTGSKLVLRLKETEVAETFEDVLSFQVDVNDLSTGQYVPMPECSKEFQIECGFFSERDGFFPIAISDPVTIPQAETGGQTFDIFASEEEKRTTLFDTVNASPAEPSDKKLTDLFNSQTYSSYSKPISSSAGSIF
ncbi:MAG: DUF4912 domain-containing protein [Chitinispirillaceae bacterium]|nr:DUF4912 domain-containing protein [Chitinispirillaceae bacterium]